MCRLFNILNQLFTLYFTSVFKGVGFVQLFTSFVMAIYYPTIASYSFTYVSQAIVSGDDFLQNGTAYGECYNSEEK